MISKGRKAELSELADYIATEDGNYGMPVDLLRIAEDNDITFNLGNYEKYFDGMLEYDKGHFHIYLNNYGTHSLRTGRLRFSFAHELGHYFIDEHRLVLESGKSLHRPSKYQMKQRDPVEEEADYFASCLLMPESQFENRCTGPFSPKLLDSLRNDFNTSWPAVVSRYMELGTVPVAMVCAEGGNLKYKLFSNDFPYKFLLADRDKKVSEYTCAGDFFKNGVTCDDTESVEAKEWFNVWDDLRGVMVNEYCIYQEKYNQTLSILWFD